MCDTCSLWAWLRRRSEILLICANGLVDRFCEMHTPSMCRYFTVVKFPNPKTQQIINRRRFDCFAVFGREAEFQVAVVRSFPSSFSGCRIAGLSCVHLIQIMWPVSISFPKTRHPRTLRKNSMKSYHFGGIDQSAASWWSGLMLSRWCRSNAG